MKLTKLNKRFPDSDVINKRIDLYNKLEKEKNPDQANMMFQLTALQKYVGILAATATVSDAQEVHQLLASINDEIRNHCLATNLTQTELLVNHFSNHSDPNTPRSNSSKITNIDKAKLPFYQAIIEYAKIIDKKQQQPILSFIQGLANELQSLPPMKDKERYELEGKKIGLLLHKKNEALQHIDNRHEDIAIARENKAERDKQLFNIGQDFESMLAPDVDNIKVRCINFGNNRVFRLDRDDNSYACIRVPYDEKEVKIEKIINVLKQDEKSSPYLAPQIDVITLPEARYYIFPWYEQGNLENYLIQSREDNVALNHLKNAINLNKEMASAVLNFRAAGVLVSDIKPANFLVNGDKLQLSDTKSLTAFNPSQEGNLHWRHFSDMTPAYSPPERELSKGYKECPNGEAVQVYGLGIGLYQSVLGISNDLLNEKLANAPFDEAGYRQLDISDPIFTLYENLGNEIQSLILDMTQQDFTKRPTIQAYLARLAQIGSIIENRALLKNSNSPVAAQKDGSINNLGFFKKSHLSSSSSPSPLRKQSDIDLTSFKKASSQEKELTASSSSPSPLRKQSDIDLTSFKKTSSQEKELTSSSLKDTLKASHSRDISSPGLFSHQNQPPDRSKQNKKEKDIVEQKGPKRH